MYRILLIYFACFLLTTRGSAPFLRRNFYIWASIMDAFSSVLCELILAPNCTNSLITGKSYHHLDTVDQGDIYTQLENVFKNFNDSTFICISKRFKIWIRLYNHKNFVFTPESNNSFDISNNSLRKVFKNVRSLGFYTAIKKNCTSLKLFCKMNWSNLLVFNSGSNISSIRMYSIVWLITFRTPYPNESLQNPIHIAHE